MLSQRAALYSFEFANNRSEKNREELNKVISLFEDQHRAILSGDKSFNLPEHDWAHINNFYYKEQMLDNKVREYIDLVRSLEDNELTKEQAQKISHQIFTKASPLLVLLNHAVSLYEKEANKASNISRLVEISGFICLCLILLYISRRVFSPLFQSITSAYEHIKLQSETLKRTSREALHLADVKSQFLANMSHEIRTPMNGILGMVNLLKSTHMDDKQQDMLETIRSCGDNLLVVLNDILDYTKLDSDKLEIEEIDFSIREMIGEVESITRVNSIDKYLDVKVEIDESLPDFFCGDVVRIKQILYNFTNNAVKFTSEGSVSLIVKGIALSENEFDLKFCVNDTGIGISEKDIKKLFKDFSQVDASTTRKYGGTGLGLSISKKLANLMNGDISVESELGKGSSFIFNVKLKAGQEVKKTQNITLEKKDVAKDFPHEILVVEDNKVNQKLAKLLLNKLGYEVDIAENGKVAIEMMSLKKYTLVFMDLQMPVMGGLEATKLLIKMYADKCPPIIAMTANAFREDRQQCEEVGMVDFISKPIDSKELLRVVTDY